METYHPQLYGPHMIHIGNRWGIFCHSCHGARSHTNMETHMRTCNIIIILDNASPYIYKAVPTLLVPGPYSLLNLEKRQLYWAGEKVGC